MIVICIRAFHTESSIVSLRLADDIVVKDAKLENGLLNISLERIIPEEKKPKLIEIK